MINDVTTIFLVAKNIVLYEKKILELRRLRRR